MIRGSEQGSNSRNSKPSVNGHGKSIEPAGLDTTRLDSIRPRPIRWLVPNLIPLGKLVLIAGDGGHGKTTLTLDMAANLTMGRPCFGKDYEAPEPCDVLLISCEDDFEDTVVPRLIAAEADLKRVHRVNGVRDPKTGSDAASERFADDCQGGLGTRRVKVTVKVPLPEPIEARAVVTEEEPVAMATARAA